MPNLALPGLLLVLGSAFLGGFLARKFRQPVFLGYLLAGLAVAFFVRRLGFQRETLDWLAEIGSALLMFTLGLEFSDKRMAALGKKVVVKGSLVGILAFTVLATLALKYLFGFPWNFALILAGAFSISSSAIVVKILEEKGLLGSLSGEIMASWLLVEDMAVLPLIIIFTLFFTGGGGENHLVFLSRSLFLFIFWLLLQIIVPFLTTSVATTRSRELLLIFSLILVLFFSWITWLAGFPIALGAFLVGLIFNQTSESLAIFSEIRPLRDVFLAIFFISLGLSLDPGFLLANLPKILGLTILVLGLKIGLGTLILGYFKFHARTIAESVLGLAQAGEFSFALAATALAKGLLDYNGYLLIASVALLTMVLSPWLFSLAGEAYRLSFRLWGKSSLWGRRFFSEDRVYLPEEELPFAGHVVILGYGRVGKWVGSALEKAQIPYLVVEYNPRIVRDLKLSEKKVVFGDPTDLNVLDFAQVDKARLVVSAIPDALTQKIAITNCRTLKPDIEIICRSHFEGDGEGLKAIGARHVIQPEFEAALSMSHRVLQTFGFNQETVLQKIKEVKKEYESVVSSKN